MGLLTLDPEPTFFANLCAGFGMPTDVTLENLLVSSGQTLVCAATNSITVASTVVVNAGVKARIFAGAFR